MQVSQKHATLAQLSQNLVPRVAGLVSLDSEASN